MLASRSDLEREPWDVRCMSAIARVGDMKSGYFAEASLAVVVDKTVA